MKIVATIEARTGSTRLPGKVLLPAGGEPILGHLISRLKKVPSIHEIVLATTTNSADKALVQLAKDYSISCYQGSEEDVMARVIGAAEMAHADLVVETLGDCPLLDPAIVEECIQLFLRSQCDYASNTHVPSFPDGMDVQVFKLSTLKKSFDMSAHPLDREHVTRHIRMHPEIFQQVHLMAPPELTHPEIVLTLDEQGDYVLLKNVIEYFKGKNYSCADIIDLLKNKYPAWLEYNQDIKRKGLHQ